MIKMHDHPSSCILLIDIEMLRSFFVAIFKGKQASLFHKFPRVLFFLPFFVTFFVSSFLKILVVVYFSSIDFNDVIFWLELVLCGILLLLFSGLLKSCRLVDTCSFL